MYKENYCLYFVNKNKSIVNKQKRRWARAMLTGTNIWEFGIICPILSMWSFLFFTVSRIKIKIKILYIIYFRLKARPIYLIYRFCFLFLLLHIVFSFLQTPHTWTFVSSI